MSIQTVSTKELRENFNWVKEELESGKPLLLLYRSKPLAEMKPVKKTRKLRSFSKRELEKWVSSDRLTEREQKQIETIIDRLP